MAWKDKLFVYIIVVAWLHRQSAGNFSNVMKFGSSNMEKLAMQLETETSTEFLQLKQLVHLLNDIGEYWNMTSIYIICNEKTASAHYLHEVLDLFHQKDNYFGRLPQMILTENSIIHSPFYEQGGFGLNSLVFTIMHTVYDTVLEVTANATRYRRSCFTIYSVQMLTLMEDRNYLFETLWRYQLRRPLVIANYRDLLTIDPYPKLRIVNMTGEQPSKMFPLAHNIKDFKGYAVNMPVQTDVPSTFLYRDEKSQQYGVDGFGGWIISELMQHLNVTLIVYPLLIDNSNYLNVTTIQQMLLQGEIEISPHVISIMAKIDVDHSYPFVNSPRCIMMPLPQRGSLNFFHFIDWRLFLFLLAFAVANELIWMFYGYIRPGTLPGQPLAHYSTIYVINILFGVPVPRLHLHNLNQVRLTAFIRLIFVYYLISFGGNYISQLFSTSLTSFLTVITLKEPKVHVGDLLAGNISLLMRPIDYRLFIERFHPSDRQMKNILEKSREEVYTNLRNLNSAYMYLVSTDEFSIIDEQQRYMDPKRFILLNICHGMYPSQMQLRADSQFTELLNRFILRMRESGLYKYQKSQLFQRAKKHGKMDYIRDDTSRNIYKKNYTFNTLSAMVYVLAVGYFCSVSAFILELYGHQIGRFSRGLVSRIKNKVLKI